MNFINDTIMILTDDGEFLVFSLLNNEIDQPNKSNTYKQN